VEVASVKETQIPVSFSKEATLQMTFTSKTPTSHFSRIRDTGATKYRVQWYHTGTINCRIQGALINTAKTVCSSSMLNSHSLRLMVPSRKRSRAKKGMNTSAT
jgi:hypothetical protein